MLFRTLPLLQDRLVILGTGAGAVRPHHLLQDLVFALERLLGFLFGNKRERTLLKGRTGVEHGLDDHLGLDLVRGGPDLETVWEVAHVVHPAVVRCVMVMMVEAVMVVVLSEWEEERVVVPIEAWRALLTGRRERGMRRRWGTGRRG